VLLRWHRGRRVESGTAVTLLLLLLPWILSHSNAAAFLLIPPSWPTATHSGSAVDTARSRGGAGPILHYGLPDWSPFSFSVVELLRGGKGCSNTVAAPLGGLCDKCGRHHAPLYRRGQLRAPRRLSNEDDDLPLSRLPAGGRRRQASSTAASAATPAAVVCSRDCGNSASRHLGGSCERAGISACVDRPTRRECQAQ